MGEWTERSDDDLRRFPCRCLWHAAVLVPLTAGWTDPENSPWISAAIKPHTHKQHSNQKSTLQSCTGLQSRPGPDCRPIGPCRSLTYTMIKSGSMTFLSPNWKCQSNEAISLLCTWRLLHFNPFCRAVERLIFLIALIARLIILIAR